jgi:hypothetical protein
MKPRLFFLALIIVLALVSIVLAGGGSAGLAAAFAPPEAATLRAGRYQLTGVTLRDTQDSTWQESDQASGGGYHLQGPASPWPANPQLTGSGCCCLYLPCVRR